MKRQIFLDATSLLALLVSPSIAAAQAIDLGTIIVESSSLSPVEHFKTGTTVEIVEGRDTIGRDTTVLQRLTRIPGVNATSNGGLGAQAGIQIRGLPSRYVGVRINGIDVADPSGTQSQFNFGGLTGSGIERIEVLKGAQSALYGSEAIAGVVEMTTFRPSEPGFSGRSLIERGSFGTYSGTLDLGYKLDRGEISLSYGYVESDGISGRSSNTEKDGFRQNTLSLTGEFDVTDTFALGAAILYRDGDVEFDRSTTDSTGKLDTEQLGAHAYARLQTGIMRHELSYNYFDIERRDPGGFTVLFQGERHGFSYLGNAELSNSTMLSFGADYSKEEVDNTASFGGGTVGQETNRSVMTELLFSPSSRIDLSAALRHDDNSDFGGATTGRLAAVWRPVEDVAIRASAATGYRAPSLYERFSAYGDSELQPEESTSFELGVEKSFGDKGYVKVTAFYTEIDDLIDFDGAATTCGSAFGCYARIPGQSTSKGIEFSGQYAVSSMFSVFGAYTYTDSANNGSRLTRTPRHDVAIGVDAQFTDHFMGYVDMRYVGDVLPSTFAPTDHKVGDYALVGLGLSHDIADTTEAYVRVENLFDEDYETAGGFNQPGRAVYVGLRANF